MRVITVMKSGSLYTHDYTRRLRQAVLKHSTVPVDFVCLTDQPEESYHVPMQHRWPGWWSKLEIFDYQRFPGHTVFIDLDTVIRDNIDQLLSRPETFIMMRDYRLTRANSCLMSWHGDHSHIIHEFQRQPEAIMQAYRSVPYVGDQALIERVKFESAQTVHFWQDLLGTEYFLNWTLEPHRRKNTQARLLWWSCGPKPHEVKDDPEIIQHWRNIL